MFRANQRFWTACLAYCFLAGHVVAGTKQPISTVRFDVSNMVACAPKTSDENFVTTLPDGEKQVSSRFDVSMFTAGGAEELSTVIYQVLLTEGPGRVAEYAPRTTLGTDVVGEIDVQGNTETRGATRIGGAAGFDATLGADAELSRQQNQGSTVRYKMLPPVNTIAAAGTSNRGKGVYFKLQKTPTTTLEGQRSLTIDWRVPQDWRAGYVRVVAQAKSARAQTPVSSFLVPLYLQGDSEARKASEQLLAFEQRLLSVTHEHRKQIHKTARPTVAHQWSLVEPDIPQDWQQQLIWRRTLDPLPEFYPLLPRKVRSAVTDYRLAKQVLLSIK